MEVIANSSQDILEMKITCKPMHSLSSSSVTPSATPPAVDPLLDDADFDTSLYGLAGNWPTAHSTKVVNFLQVDVVWIFYMAIICLLWGLKKVHSTNAQKRIVEDI